MVCPVGVIRETSAVVNELTVMNLSKVIVTDEMPPVVIGESGVALVTFGPDTPGGTSRPIVHMPRPSVDTTTRSGDPLGIGRPEFGSMLPRARSMSVTSTIGKPPPSESAPFAVPVYRVQVVAAALYTAWNTPPLPPTKSTGLPTTGLNVGRQSTAIVVIGFSPESPAMFGLSNPRTGVTQSGWPNAW